MGVFTRGVETESDYDPDLVVIPADWSVEVQLLIATAAVAGVLVGVLLGVLFLA